MAVSTVAFSLTSAAYVDVSGGYEACSFRLPLVSQRNNVIRVHLGTSLPGVDTTHFDVYEAPASSAEERQIHFTELAETDRVYVRAVSGTVSLTVYRK